MMDVDSIKSVARGRWFSIFESLGIAVPPEKKHGPCPVCGGKDRMRVDNLDGGGTYICNQHGAGDGIDLVMKSLGIDFKSAIEKITSVVGVCQESPIIEKEYDRKKSLNKLWKSSKKLCGSDPVSKYLHQRGLVLTPNYVRFAPECYESETKANMPAMVAMFLGPDGKPLTIHRTYLNGAGKAAIKSPKKIMPSVAPLIGGAVRLFPAEESTIGIAEGIETAIAATQFSGLPCWATLSASMMKGFIPPEGVRKVVIFSDNDSNFTGQAAAYSLANRLYLDGLVVDVELPAIGKDFNEYLLSGK